jgi:site-specific recombinase XerD
MGRRRSQADAWMPARVYPGKSAYEYRPIPGVCIRLCPLDSARSVVVRRHADEYERFNNKKGSIKELADLFFAAPDFSGLSVNTRKDYEKYWRGLEPVFGKMDAKKLLPEHVRKYMDIKGQKSKVQANRTLSLLSRIFSWGFERGHVTTNPCKGVRRFTESERTRYITDEEYKALYDHSPVPVQVAMELSYVCAARQGDVLKMTKSHLMADGIFIKQGKTGKQQIKAWTPRLRAAVQLASTIQTKHGSIYVLPTSSGTAYTGGGFRAIFTKARDAAREKTGLMLDFTFHDIKAKAISDYEGDKQRFSGHKTARQVSTYDRRTEVVKPHE